MARMRLCGKADVVTRTLMKEIVKKVNELNPEFKNVLVPKCEYLHECNEFQPCGRYKTLCSQ